MNAIKCEMCNSSDVIKIGDYYVCQSCGTKYNVEAAKKLIIGNTVDIQGTVKVDNSEFVKKYLANARRAKEKEDWEEAEKYYNFVEQNDPTNIEAVFYSSYAKAKSSLIERDIYKREAVFKVLTNSVSVIDDYYDIEKEAEEIPLIFQIGQDMLDMMRSNFVFNYRVNGYGIIDYSEKRRTEVLFGILEYEFVNTLEHIINKYPDGDNRTIPFYELAVFHATNVLENGNPINPDVITQRIMNLHILWNRVDARHEIPDTILAPQKGGCYIATCVYGSYDCPQVWTLRRYRDMTLASTWYGRVFIQIYYAISPTLVRLFGAMEWFKKLWKKKLDRMVSRLNDKGIDNTPYQDKSW